MVLQPHPLSHKEYVTFGDDKKGKVLGTGANLSVLFRKSDSHVLDSSGKHVCGISRIGNVFQADFSYAQSSLRCVISQSSSKL
jgi:hypothetical protein